MHATDRPAGPGPAWFRKLLLALGAAYVAALWLEAVGSPWPRRLIPQPGLYFTQIAALFPRAALDVIDYRAEGWDCAQGRFRELDLAPWFPINAGNKENGFHRLLFFYRRDPPVLAALDTFITNHWERAGMGRLGGVRLLSLRIPLPEPGRPTPRYRPLPLEEYPRAWRKVWYVTPAGDRERRCAGEGK